MRASVIIRTKDEADRLRLTLASLAAQTEKPEVVVVNDGSTDSTAMVISEGATEMDLVTINNHESIGRSAASNAGAEQATGDIVIFLDGDTLAGPDLVAKHLEAHRLRPHRIVRGETCHLRCTRSFLNPETGTPMPGEESRVLRMLENERARSVVTRQQIRQDFGAIDSRAQPGVYPGYGPRKLLELEMDALNNHPDCDVLWAAASGSNQSVSRAAFLDAGGFHKDIAITEQRELALRLCQRGLRMMGTSARTYHMTHRSGWRDPLQETAWEQIFYDAHPLPEVALLPFFWASLSETAPFPTAALISSLPELAKVAARYRGVKGLQAVREAHFHAVFVGMEKL